MEIRYQGTSTPAQPAAAANPLQDAYIRLEEAERLRQQGKLDRAQQICQALVREHPDYTGALHTLGLVLADKQDYQRAFGYLARAAMLNPRSWTTLTALSGVYLALDAPEMAAQALEQARAIKPNDASVLSTLGEIYREEREYELARDAYRQALALEPNLLPAAIGLGWTCSHIGQDAEAAQVFESLYRRGIRSLDVLHALSSLPASLVRIDVLAEIDKLIRDSGQDLAKQDKAKFENVTAFIRAAALDKAGRHAEAWKQLVPANRTHFATMRKEFEDRKEREQASLVRLRTTAHQPPNSGMRDGERAISLFILGPSRSGKTTMEGLVSGLAGVKRGFENPIVENAVRRTFQTSGLLTSIFFEHLPPQLDALCREIYIEELTRRAGSARVFTNTHPARIYDAARMASVLPNVRFIFVKRDVDDIVLRIYLRRYSAGNAYAYDLKAARDHVLWYHQTMDLLAEKLPDVVRIIHYEDLIADPAAARRVAAELCGLPAADAPLPELGDDRGCAAPYRQFIAEHLGS
jgi:Flp pilus assembly protein TadD